MYPQNVKMRYVERCILIVSLNRNLRLNLREVTTASPSLPNRNDFRIDSSLA
jgi:hypothetical protein